jgi:hypothetical protein
LIHSVTINILHTTKILKSLIHVNITIWQQPHPPYLQEWFYHSDCPLSMDTHKYANISVIIYCPFEVYIWSFHCTTEILSNTGFEKSSWLTKKLNYSGIHMCVCVWAGYLSRYSDWPRAGRSGDRNPVGARFFAHVQTGPWANPASCTMGNGSFPWVKWPGHGADQPPPSNTEVENE